MTALTALVLVAAVGSVVVLEVGHLIATTWHAARARRKGTVNPG